MPNTTGATGLIDPLLSMTSKGENALMPFRSTTLELVYGSMDYVRSVLGDGEITRQALSNYYTNARETWTKFDIPKGTHRGTVTRWCRQNQIKPLHYYAPMDCKIIWFKEKEDAFAYMLKFGI